MNTWSMTPGSTLSVTKPKDNTNIRNFASMRDPIDLSLIKIGETVYLNAWNIDALHQIAWVLGLDPNKIFDTVGKYRQYGSISGYLLETPYKSLGGGVNAIRNIYETHAGVFSILGQQKKAA